MTGLDQGGALLTLGLIISLTVVVAYLWSERRHRARKLKAMTEDRDAWCARYDAMKNQRGALRPLSAAFTSQIPKPQPTRVIARVWLLEFRGPGVWHGYKASHRGMRIDAIRIVKRIHSCLEIGLPETLVSINLDAAPEGWIKINVVVKANDRQGRFTLSPYSPDMGEAIIDVDCVFFEE